MTLLASCRLASQPKQGSEVPAYFKLLNVSFGVTKVLNDRYRKYPWLTTHGRLLPVIRCFSDGLFDAIGHLRRIQIPNARAAARSNPIPETRMNTGLSSWTRPQANREKREKFAL